ncbi:xanthine dehydrogenase accessory protein XdhC [Vibrio sp. CAIM 722]|uniref:Xanthine dehydrogenase accessory protein XdhC n=1 Tax=Vibrio eleionomae TaxID=2653505 RepID=A0A7X4RUL2_9VIBR|nr:xanthine dehydrogenase accessory protein XdhC [Vibrio eleionomae]MZI93385.1 xanthine dehydrogenase accessory protein XdhC [Vibrio eleionomae]
MHTESLLNQANLSWLKACQELEQLGQPYCLATVLAHSGSVPRSSGAKMVITTNAQYDTLGGGHLEYQVIALARDKLTAQQSDMQIERFALAADLGQCCGGAVQVLFEFFQMDTPSVIIYGAGHVGQSLATILSKLPCHTTVIDNRQTWLEQLPLGVQGTLAANPEQTVRSLRDNSYLVVMTQDHQLDYDIVANALNERRFMFVGLIGSQGKKQRFEYRLKEQLSNPELIEALTCPIGLADITGKLPMQVAVSVAGQLIALMNKQQTQQNKQDNVVLWQQANSARKAFSEIMDEG